MGAAWRAECIFSLRLLALRAEYGRCGGCTVYRVGYGFGSRAGAGPAAGVRARAGWRDGTCERVWRVVGLWGEVGGGRGQRRSVEQICGFSANCGPNGTLILSLSSRYIGSTRIDNPRLLRRPMPCPLGQCVKWSSSHHRTCFHVDPRRICRICPRASLMPPAGELARACVAHGWGERISLWAQYE